VSIPFLQVIAPGRARNQSVVMALARTAAGGIGSSLGSAGVNGNHLIDVISATCIQP
jgi:hypothetical protein